MEAGGDDEIHDRNSGGAPDRARRVRTGPRRRVYGPFTDPEAQLLSAVWPEIREAENFGDINWPAHGLARAPGSREVQRVMSANWPELRTAWRFEQIDWDKFVEGPAPQTRRYESGGGQSGRGVGPFTSAETAVMSDVWPQIREAGSYEDINWRALGLERAPGDRTGTRNHGEQLGSVSRSRAVRGHQLGRKHCVVADARAAVGHSGLAQSDPFWRPVTAAYGDDNVLLAFVHVGHRRARRARR